MADNMNQFIFSRRHGCNQNQNVPIGSNIFRNFGLILAIKAQNSIFFDIFNIISRCIAGISFIWSENYSGSFHFKLISLLSIYCNHFKIRNSVFASSAWFRLQRAYFIISKQFEILHKCWNWSGILKILSRRVCTSLSKDQNWKTVQNVDIIFSTGSFDPHSVAQNNDLAERIERMSKWIHLIFVKLGTALSVIPPPLTALINYFVLGLGDESFRFDGAFWLPFDANKPIGFTVALIFQCVAIYTSVFSFVPIFCVFLGSCWSMITFLKEIASDISHLNKKKIIKMNDRELTVRFCTFVRFHADVEKLSVDSYFK